MKKAICIIVLMLLVKTAQGQVRSSLRRTVDSLIVHAMGLTVDTNGIDTIKNKLEIKMVIRDGNLVPKNGMPLLLINNMPAALADLDKYSANDVTDIAIMKEEAAKAIYGIRAYYGAIFITLNKYPAKK